MPSRNARTSFRAALPRDVQVSKKLSWLLRHGAEKEGLKFQRGGYINVRDVLQSNSVKGLGITFRELRDVVADNNKQRFSLIRNDLSKQDEEAELPVGSDNSMLRAINDLDDPSHFLIRANQGHSIVVDSDGLLEPITEDIMPDIVVHGTTAKAWKLILQSGGLKPMTRNHIHFASGLPATFKEIDDEKACETSKTNAPVISGMRNSSTVLIYIDIQRAISNRIKFWKSQNEVILSTGDEAGIIKVEFFKKVEDRTLKKLIMQDGQLL